MITQLTASEDFMLIRNQVRRFPYMIPDIIKYIKDSKPELHSMFEKHPRIFRALLNGSIKITGENQGVDDNTFNFNPDGNTNTVLQNPPEAEMSEDDKEVITQLMALGFSEKSCVEAYLVCDKNADLAINYLLNNNEQKANNG